MPSDDAKPVKKRKEVDDNDDDDETSLGAMLQNRKKKTSASSVSTSKLISEKTVNARSKEVKVKAELEVEFADDDDDDTKPIIKKISGTKTVKVKKKVEEKTKKVYDLPGQKRDTPEERDPARIFYETLLQQVPDSEMAQFWMMESGLFPEDVAMKIFEKKQKRKSLQKQLSSPTKAIKKAVSPVAKNKTPLATPGSSNKKKSTDSKAPSRKRKIKDESSDGDDDGDDDEEDSDDDFTTKRPTKKKKAT